MAGKHEKVRDIHHPGQTIALVTASDTVDIVMNDAAATTRVARGLLVGTAGDARIIDAEGYNTGATNLVPLQKGYNPMSVRRVYSTGLTAANIWAIF